MEMLLQMALFSKDFVLSKTRFSLLKKFLLYQKIVLYCCLLFTLTVMAWQLVEKLKYLTTFEQHAYCFRRALGLFGLQLTKCM